MNVWIPSSWCHTRTETVNGFHSEWLWARSSHAWRRTIREQWKFDRKTQIASHFNARTIDHHEASIWSINAQVKKNDCMHNLSCDHPRVFTPHHFWLSSSHLFAPFRVRLFSPSPAPRLLHTRCRCLMKFTHVNETSSNTTDNPPLDYTRASRSHVDEIDTSIEEQCATASSAAS